MKKIAVCISGLVRHWEETYPLFEYWNNLYDDVEFVFFLSTWKGNTWYDKNKFPNFKITDYNFSNYEFIQDYSLHKENEVKIPERNKKLPNTFLRAYLWMKVNLLRKKYEKNNNMTFDSVMLIRNDCFVPEDLISRSVEMSNLYEYNDYNLVFTASGGEIYYETERPVLFTGNDNWWLSSSKTMNIIMDLYDWMINKKLFSTSCHKAPPEFFVRNNIHNFSINSAPIKLYREEPLVKNGNPTPQFMRNLIEKIGVKEIYNIRFQELVKMWHYE